MMDAFQIPGPIVYYISGHGFGHAVRSIQIINELLRLGCEVWIKTTAPPFLFNEDLDHRLPLVSEQFDVGLYQLDNIRFDLEKTKGEVKRLLKEAEALISREQAFFEAEKVSGVVCDIPFIPLAAAAGMGIPAIGVSNFSWDWIYSSYCQEDPEWVPLVETIRGYYQAGGVLLRLPFYGEMGGTFRYMEDIPLVARHSRTPRSELRRKLALPEDRKIGLIGYTRLDLSEKALKKIKQLSSEYLFLIHAPLKWGASIFKSVDKKEISFVDMVHMADFVMTKPGYGMVSECLSHGTPMIYSDRGLFPEYPILVAGIKSQLSSCYMPQEDLYSGNWGPYLKELAGQPRRQPDIKTNGALMAAKRIVERINKGEG